MGRAEDIQLGWAGTRTASTSQRAHSAVAGRDFGETCRPRGLNCIVQGGCRPWLRPRHRFGSCRRAVPWNGCLFPHTPAEAGPTASSARQPGPRQPICTWSSCPRSDCFGLFISCSRLCCLLPPRANHFAKLPRYTNFVWQLTSLADEFCHHPSPELISLPVLQS